MTDPKKANRFQLLIQKLAATRAGSQALAIILPYLDHGVLTLSKGRLNATSMMAGLPLITVTTKGARSGRPRIVRLVAVPDSKGYAVIASSFGRTKNPAWYYNLLAHPRVAVASGERSDSFIAREAGSADREAIWQRALELYPGFASYRERASHRTIPIMILESVTR
jgi:deazaflavin-dependent oxidoreductase (nitroreductase family)